MEKIVKYFRLGLSYKEILCRLLLKDNIEMSMISLKRRLKKLGLFRRKNKTDLEVVISFLDKELQSSGQLPGYRMMHRRYLNFVNLLK